MHTSLRRTWFMGLLLASLPARADWLPQWFSVWDEGRVLVGGYKFIGDGSGYVASRLVELTASGQACRQHIDFGMGSRLRGAASAHGWSVLGIGTDSNSWPTDRIVHSYDADGRCNLVSDAIFVDGFDAEGDR